ncbi:MAG: TIGR01458 family HAD-type hydrolase [Verrucomicrobiota bacterium]
MEIPALQGLLIDLDGVLYVGNQPIEGAREALQAISDRGIVRRFITNTTTRTTIEVVEKLNHMGFAVDKGEVFSAVTATVSFLRKQKGGNPSVELIVRDSVRPEFNEFPADDEYPDFVVVGDIGAAWSYPLMNRAFRQILNGAELIAMHKNKFFQGEDGLLLDIGAFVQGLEFATGQTARIIGKPTRDFFAHALASLNLPAKQVAMIGDDIESDVGGGQAIGLGGILVTTGKFREVTFEASAVEPDLILQSIADLPEVLKEQDMLPE